jgi:N-methylhydantoinase B
MLSCNSWNTRSIDVSGFVGGECRPVIDDVMTREGLSPGDVILTNHPYMSGALSSHLH